MYKIRPVILAGGSGTRLWPMSRTGYPKQFINFVDSGHSLFQQTLLRCRDWLGSLEVAAPIVVCNEENRFMVAEQLRQLDWQTETIILEPSGKNTAPAVSLAASYMLKHDLKEPMFVLASDHLIQNESAFDKAVAKAVELADKGSVVTFGVPPVSPETGYGYIKCGEPLGAGFAVECFVEKPDLKTAHEYVESQNYFWNSGMFLVAPQLYQDELQAHAVDIFDAVQSAMTQAKVDFDFFRADPKAFDVCRPESIDYAIMEKTQKAALIVLESHWSDVGAWSAVAEAMAQDEQGNAHYGDVLSVDSTDCLIRAESRLVATVGLNNLVVVETADAVLVADKQASQQVGAIVKQLKQLKRKEIENHTRVYRPWGWYETMCLSNRFQVKRIMVKPGEQLSLQLHHHRAEHWIVVQGTANITRGKESILLTEDQSTYIPLGMQHRLMNPGKIPLELIEIQTGSYLGEDDIVRFDDQYGRVPSS